MFGTIQTIASTDVQIALQRWPEALELLGEENPFRSSNIFKSQGMQANDIANVDTPSIKNSDGGIRLEASMCHLRGLCFASLNNFDRAKKCFQEALTVDAKCYEALDQLLSNSLMTSEEGMSPETHD